MPRLTSLYRHLLSASRVISGIIMRFFLFELILQNIEFQSIEYHSFQKHSTVSVVDACF